MHILTRLIGFYLSCPLCVRCGSLQVQESFLCANCENEFLFERMQIQNRSLNLKNEEYKVYYLLNWIPEESDSLSEMIYLLKGQYSENAWLYYSNIFYWLLKFRTELLLTDASGVIPVPSRNSSKKSYHTKYFSESLCRLSKGTSLPCLVSEKTGDDQKKLNLGLRADVEFEFNEEFTSQISMFDQIVFVDDIITSGSTLQAAIRAVKPYLKKSCKINIIALFSREKI